MSTEVRPRDEDVEAVLSEYHRVRRNALTGAKPLPGTASLFFMTKGMPEMYGITVLTQNGVEIVPTAIVHGEVFERPPTRSPMLKRWFDLTEILSPYNTCNS